MSGAGGDGIADPFDFHDAEAATAKGVETVIVAKRGDILLQTLRDFVNGFAFGKGGALAVDGDR